jgi:short-subunit dehydrogenase
LLFGTALANSYLIYKENYTASKVTILHFCESLVRSLLLGLSFEKLKPGVKQKSAAQAKRKLADHKLEEKEGSARDVRRRCAGYYEKIRQYQSRKASLETAKK